MLEMTSRVLYKIKVDCDQNNDDCLFNVVFPVLQKVVKSGGIGFTSLKANNVNVLKHDDDQPVDAEEQLHLVMHILATKCKTKQASEGLRRDLIAELLILWLDAFPSFYNQISTSLLQLSKFINKYDIKPLLGALMGNNMRIRKTCLSALKVILFLIFRMLILLRLII